MLVRVVVTYALLTVCAIAAHDNSYAVFELREHVLMLTINLWELFSQLEYAHPELRIRVYEEIHMIQQEINRAIELLIQLDQRQHPQTP